MPVKILIKNGSSNKPKLTPQNPSHGATGALENSSLIPIIDKLSVTLPIPEADYVDVRKAVYTQINDKEVFQSAQKSGRFKVVHLIAIPGSAERVHFSFDPKDGKPPHARFELNPDKLGTDGIDALHSQLISILPDGWDYVVQYGRITRLDVAVDLPGARMHQFLLLPAKGLTVRDYTSSGKLKTLYVGKPTGNQTKVYSKSFEQAAKGNLLPAPVVRVERTFKNPKTKQLKDLGQLPNPFATLQLIENVPTAPNEKQKWFWPYFLDAVRGRGLIPALAGLPEERRLLYREHFKKYAHQWWQPDKIWSQWPETISNLKINIS